MPSHGSDIAARDGAGQRLGGVEGGEVVHRSVKQGDEQLDGLLLGETTARENPPRQGGEGDEIVGGDTGGSVVEGFLFAAKAEGAAAHIPHQLFAEGEEVFIPFHRKGGPGQVADAGNGIGEGL